MNQIKLSLCLGALAMMLALPSVSDADDSGGLSEVSNFSLQATPQDEGDAGAGAGAGAGDGFDVEGPVSMRSADVQEQGTFDLKIVFDYGTSSDGSDDDYGNRVEVQWGVCPDNEIVFKLPINYGDGEEGNADVSIGWQWKLYDQQDWIPATAIYNELRLPTGNGSEGVDWEIRGVFTWDVNPGTCRLHVNPFIRVMDGDNVATNARHDLDRNRGNSSSNRGNFFGNRRNDVSARHFAAGGIIGFDHRLTDSTVVNIDYILDSGRLDGYSMQHSMEAGMDYQLTDNQMLAWATRWTLDGDDQGDNWGLSLSYIFSF